MRPVEARLKVEVRWFASLADRAGTEVEVLEVEAGTDVARLWEILVERHPAIGRVCFRPLAACDLEYADWSRKLDGVREVAFLPPVSGG